MVDSCAYATGETNAKHKARAAPLPDLPARFLAGVLWWSRFTALTSLEDLRLAFVLNLVFRKFSNISTILRHRVKAFDTSSGFRTFQWLWRCKGSGVRRFRAKTQHIDAYHRAAFDRLAILPALKAKLIRTAEQNTLICVYGLGSL